MSPGMRLLMGTVGAYFAWSLVRSLRTGEIDTGDSDYTQTEQPIRFALAVLCSIVAIVLCACLAAGVDLDAHWRAITASLAQRT